MPNGKPAGTRCVQLGDDNACRIFGMPERPAFCGGLAPGIEMCGDSREHAMVWLTRLESATAPGGDGKVSIVPVQSAPCVRQRTDK